jgi:hypothetical protein
MNAIADICTVLFVGLFTYALVATHLLRWMIDKEKFSDSKISYLRSWTPPREVLTSTGVQVWRSRWYALAASIAFLTVRCYLDTR